MAFDAELYRALRKLGVDYNSSVLLANGSVLTETQQTPIGEVTTGPTDLSLVGGLPYTRTITLRNGKTIWPLLSAFEARMEVRETGHGSTLILDARPYLTKAFVGNDIAITLTMTGAQTRPLRSGNYDMVVSDADDTDARAQRLVYGSFSVTQLISDMLSTNFTSVID